MSMWRIALIALLSGCSSATVPENPPDARLEYRPCALGTRVGQFRIELVAEPAPGFTSVSGRVAAGLVPADVPELVQSAGECRLLRQRSLFCDPPCGSAETCGGDGRCIVYPANHDVGVVTVSGLARPVRMSATANGRYFDTTLPYPGFAPEAPVHLSAQGGELAPFALRGAGVAPIVLPAQSLALERERPFDLTWTASSGTARIELIINVDQHGNTPATLVCDLGDTGATSVPADLVTALLAAGTSGYPRLSLFRRTADSATLAHGCVELVVEAGVERPIQVSGHTPCMRDADCPAGATCDPALQGCR